jgi:TonB family protein
LANAAASEPYPVDTATATPEQPARMRLVIRVRLASEPTPSRVSRLQRSRALAIVGAASLLAVLVWMGVTILDPARPIDAGSTPTPLPAAQNVRARQPAPQVLATPPTEPSASVSSPNSARPAPQGSGEPEEPPAAIDEVLPTVPRSALQTIRGTIRVSIRVSIAADGQVRSASSHEAGPSRYFERLSMEAARKWTFTPSASSAERTMFVRFHYTVDGVKAHASAP